MLCVYLCYQTAVSFPSVAFKADRSSQNIYHTAIWVVNYADDDDDNVALQ